MTARLSPCGCSEARGFPYLSIVEIRADIVAGKLPPTFGAHTLADYYGCGVRRVRTRLSSWLLAGTVIRRRPGLYCLAPDAELRRQRLHWSEEEVRTLVQMRAEGRTTREIARKLDRNPTAVQMRWHRLCRETA